MKTKGCLGSIAVIAGLAALACSDTHLVLTVADGPMTISSDWVVIIPKDDIFAKRKVQELQVAVPRAGEFKRDGQGRGVIVLPDGKEVSLEAKLVGENGAVWPLEWEGSVVSSGNVNRLVLPAQDIPAGTTIKSVEVRSSNAIQCLGITWVSYNPEDTKTGT